MRLSILICSLNVRKRQDSLQSLLNCLEKQKTPEVEVLVEKDLGKMSIGHKRNILLKRATGDYISFVDDDDMVSYDYVEQILNATQSSPDCCGIWGILVFQSKNTRRKFVHSIQYNTWFEKDGIYYRCPNHLSPVKRELALQTSFHSISMGEDKDYSLRLYPLLKTEVMIEPTLYYYLTR